MWCLFTFALLFNHSAVACGTDPGLRLLGSTLKGCQVGVPMEPARAVFSSRRNFPNFHPPVVWCFTWHCGCAGDHTAWDREEIIEMLDIFVNITQAITLPDLKEYYWRNDKVLPLLAIVCCCLLLWWLPQLCGIKPDLSPSA